MSAYDDDVVGVGVHLAGFGVHRRSEVVLAVVRPVECDTSSVAAIIVVGESEFLGHLVVPGFLHGPSVVLYVGIADDVQHLWADLWRWTTKCVEACRLLLAAFRLVAFGNVMSVGYGCEGHKENCQ